MIWRRGEDKCQMHAGVVAFPREAGMVREQSEGRYWTKIVDEWTATCGIDNLRSIYKALPAAALRQCSGWGKLPEQLCRFKLIKYAYLVCTHLAPGCVLE